MRTILSLGLALVLGTGVATLTGCEKKGTKVEDTKTHEATGPGGAKVKEETKVEKTETPPKDNK
ncbi:MAG TPA: hypothetical protein VHV55_27175 [Pirellulales bacterium]|jgi:hypothetical protein|nr:hypothetical protein [Pirellulales bacterium]